VRTISLTRRSKKQPLHIEAPGCIINITTGLSDADGNAVTHISISASGDRYSGEPAWWIDGKEGEDGLAVRVVQDGA